MPKELDYPRKSFVQSLELAEAVDFLGGNTSIENAAEKLNQSAKGGSFVALVSAAVKHRLIEGKKGFVSNTDLYRNIKLAYSEEEKNAALRKAFLEPVVYKNIYEKFKNKELPVQMLNKILIREFNVADDIASRVAKYFLEGASFTQLLNGNKLIELDSENGLIEDAETLDVTKNNLVPEKSTQDISQNNTSLDDYFIFISGPGINSKITINDEDDFYILEAIINKLKKRFQEKSSN
jgi:hypothetical protein